MNRLPRCARPGSSSAGSGDRDRRDRLRPARGALEAARRADRRGRTAGRRERLGSPPGGRGVADILEHNAPGAFEITYYPGEAALRDAIHNRDVYGGISFGPDGRTC